MFSARRPPPARRCRGRSNGLLWRLFGSQFLARRRRSSVRRQCSQGRKAAVHGQSRRLSIAFFSARRARRRDPPRSAFGPCISWFRDGRGAFKQAQNLDPPEKINCFQRGKRLVQRGQLHVKQVGNRGLAVRIYQQIGLGSRKTETISGLGIDQFAALFGAGSAGLPAPESVAKSRLGIFGLPDQAGKWIISFGHACLQVRPRPRKLGPSGARIDAPHFAKGYPQAPPLTRLCRAA